jgi:hypothetical protein
VISPTAGARIYGRIHLLRTCIGCLCGVRAPDVLALVRGMIRLFDTVGGTARIYEHAHRTAGSQPASQAASAPVVGSTTLFVDTHTLWSLTCLLD